MAENGQDDDGDYDDGDDYGDDDDDYGGDQGGYDDGQGGYTLLDHGDVDSGPDEWGDANAEFDDPPPNPYAYTLPQEIAPDDPALMLLPEARIMYEEDRRLAAGLPYEEDEDLQAQLQEDEQRAFEAAARAYEARAASARIRAEGIAVDPVQPVRVQADDIHLSRERLQQIQTAMQHLPLPPSAIPPWARDSNGEEKQDWQVYVQTRVQQTTTYSYSYSVQPPSQSR